MKIVLIGFAKIKYMPYANFYLQNLDCLKHEVHMVYWNRDLKEEDTEHLKNISLHEFKFYQEDCEKKTKKIKAFRNYKKFTEKTLKEIVPDFIIILHSLPGVLLYKKLKKNYSHKYIFDYRDSTYERFFFYKMIIHGLVKNSRCTFVSSDAFRRFLPNNENNKIYTSHNILMDSLNHKEEKKQFGVSSDKIRIAFWGFLREENLNREIIKRIAVDERFELHYYGREQQISLNLKSFTKGIKAKNVFFHGEYKPEERYQFVRKTDIIHNIYNNKNMMLAMSNKYYDGIVFGIPQVCMIDSFMGLRCEQNKVGKMVNPYFDSFTEDIYQYYKNLRLENLYLSIEKELAEVLQEYQMGIDILKEIFSEQI